jgi:hypothetical protein
LLLPQPPLLSLCLVLPRPRYQDWSHGGIEFLPPPLLLQDCCCLLPLCC